MHGPVDRNRLADESSPHLQSHADEPVNWQPWDEQAFDAAHEHDRPIFLSVGHSACHWCHVMAAESFEDEAVATLLNQYFVPIKVDSLARPDIDHSYQTVCQQVNGRSGWPLSVWLTPDRKPFQIETYVPAEGTDGQPGFVGLLAELRDSWDDPENRDCLEQRAKRWAGTMVDTRHRVPGTARTPPDDTLLTAARATVRGADREYGGWGWGTGPKFPYPGRIRLLLRAYERTERDIYRTVATEALDAMANGGIYDHLGGGFHRCADRTWTVPQFEKLLHTNAALVPVYLAAYRLTGEQRYRTVTTETLEFIQGELTGEHGAFVSALGTRTGSAPGQEDQQSQRGHESHAGAFYRWTPTEVQNALVEEDAGLFTTAGVDRRNAELFCDRYGITEGGDGDVDRDIDGASVLTRRESVETLADRHDLSITQVTQSLDTAREELEATREQRPRPGRDEQILAGWNGLALSAFARAGILLDDAYVEPATDALERLYDWCWDETIGRLARRGGSRDTNGYGFLEDYAFLGRGAFDCYQATGEIEPLAFALELARAIERDFWDETDETLYFTARESDQLPLRPQVLADNPVPSSTAVAVELLDALEPFTVAADFGRIAAQVIETHGDTLRSNPLEHASLTVAADVVTGPDTLDRAIVAEDPLEKCADRDPLERDDEQTTPRPPESGLLVWQPRNESELDGWLEELELAERPPVWQETCGG